MTPLLIINFKGQAVSSEQTQAPELTLQAAETAPATAVYVTGDVPDYMRELFSTYLFAALADCGADANEEISAAFIAAANEEQSKRNTALNDSLICELGRKTGLRYICVASVNPAPGTFALSARIVSVKTGKSRYDAEVTGPLNTMDDFGLATAALLEKMFGGKRVFGGQTPHESEPATAPPGSDSAAQEPEPKPAIAVYVAGDSIPKTTKDALSAFLSDALVNSGLYRTIERSETFLTEIDKEHVKQRDGSVDDAQISQIGKQAGVRFVCVANITQTLGSYQVSARVIDVETAAVSASGVSASPLESLTDLKQVSASVVYKMLGVKMKADENFELLTNNEKTALEQSIQETVQQTMRSKQPYRKSFWIALSCDIVGAGILGLGLYEEMSVGNNIDNKQYTKATAAETARNVCYVVGALVLASGISIHILF